MTDRNVKSRKFTRVEASGTRSRRGEGVEAVSNVRKGQGGKDRKDMSRGIKEKQGAYAVKTARWRQPAVTHNEQVAPSGPLSRRFGPKRTLNALKNTQKYTYEVKRTHQDLCFSCTYPHLRHSRTQTLSHTPSPGSRLCSLPFTHFSTLAGLGTLSPGCARLPHAQRNTWGQD